MKINFIERFRYVLVLLIANVASFFVMSFLAAILVAVFEGEKTPVLRILANFTYLISFAVVYIILYKTLKNQVSEQFVPSDDKWMWLKSGCSYTALGEGIRFLINMFPIDFVFLVTSIKFGQLLALPSYFLFNLTYLASSGRSAAIFRESAYIPMDFIAYALCYIVYLAAHMAIVLLIYRHFWKKAEKEHTAMLQVRMTQNNL